GDTLEGSGAMPPLVGPDFTANWSGKTIADLFEKTHGTMPASAPGTLSEQQTADVLAYMLQVAQYPAGSVELAAGGEVLKSVTLDAPPAGGAAPAAGAPAAAGAGASTVAQGVYTEVQATRGATIYAEQCAGCHGEK